MKTWRERIAEARERGAFLREDQLAWMELNTCPAGEYVSRFGLEACESGYHHILHPMGTELGRYIYKVNFNPDGAEALVDAIEDKALELKRESR